MDLDAAKRLASTPHGKVILAVLVLYGVIVLGDSGMRLVGAGPYHRTYAGEILSKRTSTPGWVVQVMSGRSLFRTTEKKGPAGRATVGPWRVTIRTDAGDEVEVAVPVRTYERARVGMHIEQRAPGAHPALTGP